MKQKFIIILILIVTFCNHSCTDLDRAPLAEGSTGSWYSTEEEVNMGVAQLYTIGYWKNYWDYAERWTDNYTYRDTNEPLLAGTFNSESSIAIDIWEKLYRQVSQSNSFIYYKDRALSFMEAEKLEQLAAEACFFRAVAYSQIVYLYGDPVYYTEPMDIATALTMSRTPKAEAIKYIYEDFDFAIDKLPVSYSSSQLQKATKGAALAFKARFALYMGDWEVAAKAAKDCMDLGVYSLHADFGNFFLKNTRSSAERIFILPRSVANSEVLDQWFVNNQLPRNAGGYASANPSWDLLAAFTCTDGLPIDESPLFDPRNPFKNRDPRCAMTIVEFGTEHCGYEFNPHPDALEVMNYNTGNMQANQDTRAVAQYTSYNGIIWKKGIDATWLENGKTVDNDFILFRYAEILHIYAEAKIELNQIDQTVLDAINMVRARAYKVDKGATDQYPAVTTTNQAQLRKIIRNERRVEFANEKLRYMDVIRWGLAKKAFNTKNYGILYPADDLRENVTNKGLWFWSHTPTLDEDGIADFSAMEKAGTATVLSQRFWDERQMLWPLPATEVLTNTNLVQNPGY